jgi:transposase
VQKFKCFVYKKAKFVTQDKEPYLEVEVEPRKNSQALCSGCEQPCPGYDSLKPRLFEFVPLWGMKVFLRYAMRRVNCPSCGIKVEQVPWASGKQRLCYCFMQYLASWAKKLSWAETANSFKVNWSQVYEAVRYVVNWGLANRDLTGIESIGVDEIAWKKGQRHYLTLVYQIDKHCVRLLWIGKDRTIRTLLRFFRWFGKDKTQGLKHICSDMWRAYIKVINKKAPHALHILDRFHIVANLNKAIDEVRASEHKQLIQDGYQPVLKHSRWCVLKRPENLTSKQKLKLKDLLKYNLKTVKAYLLKEEFQGLWEYVSVGWADKFIERWCRHAMYSKIEPIKKVARSIRKHKPLIINWFKAKKQFSSGIVEGLNNKVKLATKKAYGFREVETIEIALYHQLGGLPEPPITHRF